MKRRSFVTTRELGVWGFGYVWGRVSIPTISFGYHIFQLGHLNAIIK